jgi:hypothetical protein
VDIVGINNCNHQQRLWERTNWLPACHPVLGDWTSSNVIVATVSLHGVASGLLSGTSTITASFDGVNANAILTVH